jgi:peptidoglycan/LPS O-acetylase OafA/YrhL
LTVLVALVSWRFVEKPALAYKNKPLWPRSSTGDGRDRSAILVPEATEARLGLAASD